MSAPEDGVYVVGGFLASISKVFDTASTSLSGTRLSGTITVNSDHRSSGVATSAPDYTHTLGIFTVIGDHRSSGVTNKPAPVGEAIVEGHNVEVNCCLELLGTIMRQRIPVDVCVRTVVYACRYRKVSRAHGLSLL